MKKILASIALALVVAVLAGVLSGCTKYDYYERPEEHAYKAGHEFDEGFGNTNNGYAKNDAEVQRLISVTPSQRQLDYLELEYYNFAHFGMNTFSGNEWGTGKEDPNDFDPKNLNTDQWCEALKASGSKGIILTAKHHDGFCLWQTSTTEHSVKNSKWKNGQGDVVKMLSESCEKYGLKMGIYLSPWDMNAESYGDTEAYNEFYMDQLTELLNGDYGPDLNGDGKGEIFCVWMDGARGEEVPEDFEYHMDDWEKLIWDLQPDCVAANMGSEVRWVGNEAGIARESEWSVVSEGDAANQQQQTSEEDAERLQSVSAEAEDKGSRELLAKYRDLIFYPAETDVSIRKGWFYHWNQSPKALDHLMQIYFTSVGGNSSLLLNVTPNKDGLIPSKDVKRLKEFGKALNATKAEALQTEKTEVGYVKDGKEVMYEKEGLQNLLNAERDGYTFTEDEYILDFYLSKEASLGRIDLREDLRYSQRVELFEVWVKDGAGNWVLIGDSTVIGNRRILLFEDAPVTKQVRLVIKQSRSVPVLRSVELYRSE